jgi:hypothetical protein
MEGKIVAFPVVRGSFQTKEVVRKKYAVKDPNKPTVSDLLGSCPIKDENGPLPQLDDRDNKTPLRLNCLGLLHKGNEYAVDTGE